MGLSNLHLQEKFHAPPRVSACRSLQMLRLRMLLSFPHQLEEQPFTRGLDGLELGPLTGRALLWKLSPGHGQSLVETVSMVQTSI